LTRRPRGGRGVMGERSYDQRCLDLAVFFLTEEGVPFSPADEEALAQAIQDAIEEWLGAR